MQTAMSCPPCWRGPGRQSRKPSAPRSLGPTRNFLSLPPTATNSTHEGKGRERANLQDPQRASWLIPSKHPPSYLAIGTERVHVPAERSSLLITIPEGPGLRQGHLGLRLFTSKCC